MSSAFNGFKLILLFFLFLIARKSARVRHRTGPGTDSVLCDWRHLARKGWTYREQGGSRADTGASRI